MIFGQPLSPIEIKSRIFAIPARASAETGLNVWLRFIDRISNAWRRIEEREQLCQLNRRQLEDIGLTVAERDALAGLPRL